ncbi:acetylxylan esterase [Kutzneria kofuensis]|uniref:acetylxylan esterase n=1 Tax=Kutzneria kofuensis TaxID=103725 RepID=UPI003CD07846
MDCALLARRITATTLFSVGLMDMVCPPSTVYAAYNEITAPRRSRCPRSRA